MANEQGLVTHAFYDFAIPEQMYADIIAMQNKYAEAKSALEAKDAELAELRAQLEASDRSRTFHAARATAAEAARDRARNDALEEAAKVADREAQSNCGPFSSQPAYSASWNIAAAIRALAASPLSQGGQT